MNLYEAKAALHELANKLVERSQGVATMELVNEFKSTYGDAVHDLGVGLVDDWLRRVSKDLVNRAGRGRSEQLALPGMGEVDAFVTVPDGEGGFRRKKLIYASECDLDADEKIHETNVNAAVRALAENRQRNNILREAMRSQGFDVAGDAIVWLNSGTPGAT